VDSIDGNIGVTGYNIFRGGVKDRPTAPSTISKTETEARREYTYNVSAFDAAGKYFAQSTGASATTQAAIERGGIPVGARLVPDTGAPASVLCPVPRNSGNSGCQAVMSAWSSGLFDTKRNG